MNAAEFTLEALETPALTKAHLADLLFEQIGLNKRESKDMVEAFFDLIANSLIEGVRPTVVKDQIEHPATIAYEKWNSFSRITVGQPERTRPAL